MTGGASFLCESSTAPLESDRQQALSSPVVHFKENEHEAIQVCARPVLTASLLSAPAFAQQTPTTQTTAQTSVDLDQGLDLYVNGTQVASGAPAYSDTIATLETAGDSTITAFRHGAAPSTATPLYSVHHSSTLPNQVIHVVIGATSSILVY